MVDSGCRGSEKLKGRGGGGRCREFERRRFEGSEVIFGGCPSERRQIGWPS